MNWVEGDWMCGVCQHHNFRQRDTCQVCQFPKLGVGNSEDAAAVYRNKTEVRPGDWFCSAVDCGAHNYASRSNCYRCGALKGLMMACSSFCPPGWKPGDWFCNRSLPLSFLF